MFIKSITTINMKIIFLVFISILSSVSYSQLTADFSATPLSICIGESIQFADLSTAGNSPISNWNWDFGDGGSSTSQNPTHVYSLPGNYNITLTIQAQDGSSDFEVKPTYITVFALPVSNFSFVGTACNLPFNAQFSNFSSNGGNMTYAWDFGNGQTSTDFSPTGIVYNSVGTFDVSLTVSNSTTGCSKDTTITITINDFNGGIAAPDTVCVGSSAQIDNASTPAGTSWQWNYGDAGVSFSENAAHTYTTAGPYTITLTVQDATTGCQDVVTQNILVLPLPTPTFTALPVVGCAPLDVTYTNTSVGGVDYNWDFGNGTNFNGETPPIVQYSSNGSYSVSLTMTDAFGCINTTTQANLITVAPVQANFTMDAYNGCSPIDVNFTDASIAPNPGVDPITSWNWNFGNGSTFSGQNPPTQTYTTGLYSVSLTVTTSNGCMATVTFIDTIQVGAIDLVDFSYTPINDCAKSDFDFTDLSVISAPHDPSEVTYEWDFGDGGSSTDQHPTYNYPIDTGYFDVQLIVDFRGCKDTVTKPQIIFIKAPISRFTASETLFCNPVFPVSVDFTDNSIIGAIPDDAEMFWSWGDGTPDLVLDDPDFDDADLGSTTHVFTGPGTYTVQQAIYNYTTGCEDSTTVMITMSNTVADFTISNDSVCVNSSLSVTDASTSTTNPQFGTYSYDWGDGSVVSGANQIHTYTIPGTYDVILIATNSAGCADTATVNGVEVLNLPVAALTASDTSGCVPLGVTYTNNSTSQGNGVGLESFLWTFSDLTTQTTTDVSQTVNFMHNQLGTFAVTLVVTDSFGCVSPLATVSVATSKPNAVFLFDSIVCNNANYIFQNNSGGYSPVTYEWFIDGISEATTTNLNGQFNDPESAASNVINHTVMLIATDVNGCLDTAIHNVNVAIPHADVNYSFNGASVNGSGQYVCPPVFASLTDISSSYGNITNWSWTFGNGNTSIDQNPDNTYVFAGTYSASLTIIDEYGCTDDTVLVDYLTIAGPSADVSVVNVGDQCNPEYEFVADNLVDVFNIEWTLDDGSVVNSTSNFTHPYANGTYTPTVIVSDATGCQIPFILPTISVTSNELTAFFESSATVGNVTDLFTFYDMSTSTNSPIVSWDWNFDNNTISSNSNVNVDNTWFIPGEYPVILTVTDAFGCSDSYAITVLIDGEVTIPNVFTPNADGANDLFTIDYDIFDGYDIVIINRWGEVMNEIQNHSGTILWDGTNLSGNPASEGVYFYKLIGKTYKGETLKFHGNVTLIRD